MFSDVDFDWALRLVREKMDVDGVTQSDVARMAGISRQRVSLLMRGKSKSRRTLRMIVRALHMEKEVRAPSIY